MRLFLPARAGATMTLWYDLHSGELAHGGRWHVTEAPYYLLLTAYYLLLTTYYLLLTAYYLLLTAYYL